MPTQRRIGAVSLRLAMGLAFLCSLAAPRPAGATTLRRMDLPDLVAHSQRVVHARAVSNRVYWDPTHSQIYTDTVFETIGEAKGSGPKKLTITQLGGRIDPLEMLVDGTPTFRAGEEVVLFAEPRPGGNHMIVGLSQGVMRVSTDPTTGERVAIGEVPEAVSFVGGRPVRSAAKLDDLMDEVRQLAGGGAANRPARGKPATDPVRPGGVKP